MIKNPPQWRRCKRHRFFLRVRKIPWRRKGQPTPVFLPRKPHGQRSLLGYNLWGCKELDMTEQQVWHGIYTVSGIIINLEMIYSIRGYIYVYCIILYRDLGLLRFSYPQEVWVSIPHGCRGWLISLKMRVVSGWCTNTGKEKSLSHSLSGKYSYRWIYTMKSLATCPGISQNCLQLNWFWNFDEELATCKVCSGAI